MIRNVEVARERTELLELVFINEHVLLEREGEFQLAVLATTEVVDRPLNPALSYIEITAIWIRLCLLWLDHLLDAV